MVAEILSGRVVVAAVDLVVAAAHGGVNRSTRGAVQIEGEGTWLVAGGAGVPARRTVIGFQVGWFVEPHGRQYFMKTRSYHSSPASIG